MITKETYSFDEACIYLNTSGTTLQELVVSGAVKGAKIGMSWVFMRKHLEAYLESEIERQTMERIECTRAGIKPRVLTAKSKNEARRNRKPDLDTCQTYSPQLGT